MAHEGARRVANRGGAHRALQHGGEEGAEELVRDGPQLLFALLRFLCRPGRWSTRLKLQRPPEGSAQVDGNVAKIDLAARGVDGALVHFNAPSWAVRAVMSSTTLPVCPKTGSTSPSLTVHLCLHTAPGNRECAQAARGEDFKVSTDPTDPQFAEKFWDVIGLYLDPPERALVLCCDEKSQCQALERTQPGLPLRGGAARTQTHDYRRHGTITLFAALNYLDGKLIARTEVQHTHVEWLRFLKQVDRETPSTVDLHLIVDNYCTHKDHRVRAWLAKHPRFHLHFTPTSASWLNLIERFADLTQDVIREGSFDSVRALVTDVERYLADRNLAPKPYKWKAAGEAILRKIQRARATLAAPQERRVR